MNDAIKTVFEKENIEYYAVLPYEKCRETNRGIIEREDFTPRSVILYLIPYYSGDTVNLSRYAASLDYHIAIRDIAERVLDGLREVFPDSKSRGYGDHSPIDECHAALVCSLGVRGDNGLLINEKYGSYVFIGDVVTDIPPELLGECELCEPRGCMHCGLCHAACPTGILRGEGDDCLSAVTQRKGELTDDEVALMREVNTVWGCDICQEVCPYNASPVESPIEFFSRDRIPLLTLEEINNMSKEEFSLRAFAWRGRKTVARNLELLGY